MRHRSRTLAAVLALACLGCASAGVVQLSPDTYMISREDHRGIFGSLASLKAEIIREANAFAAKEGKVAIPISAKERPMGTSPGQWASFDYQFRVVDKNDPEARRTSLVPRPDVVIETTQKLSVDSPRPAEMSGVGTAEVSIASSVENADVYVDGKFVGNAPLPNYRLNAGTHSIEVRAAGYEAWSRELTVAPNAASRIVAQLKKLP